MNFVVFFIKVKPEEEGRYEEFWNCNYYIAGGYDSRLDFENLNKDIQIHENVPVANRIFYLALPPSVFEPVTVHIRNSCMAQK